MFLDYESVTVVVEFWSTHGRLRAFFRSRKKRADRCGTGPLSRPLLRQQLPLSSHYDHRRPTWIRISTVQTPDQSYRRRDTFAIILQGTCTLYSIVDASCFWIFNVAAAAAAVVDFFGQRMAGFALFFAAGKYLSCLMWDRTMKRLREQWSRDNVSGGL